MNILSDEEIEAAQGDAYSELSKTGYNGGMGGVTWDRASARAIEAAVVKRLAAGVSMEPDGWRTQEYIGAPSQQEPYYNADTFTAALAAAGVQENERCQTAVARLPYGSDTADCMDAIRALLGKEAT